MTEVEAAKAAERNDQERRQTAYVIGDLQADSVRAGRSQERRGARRGVGPSLLSVSVSPAINAAFFARVQRLICRSRLRAALSVRLHSQYTS